MKISLAALYFGLCAPCVAQDKNDNQIQHIVNGEVRGVVYLNEGEEGDRTSTPAAKRPANRNSVEASDESEQGRQVSFSGSGQVHPDLKGEAGIDPKSESVSTFASPEDQSILISELIKRANRNQVNSLINGNLIADSPKTDQPTVRKEPIIPGYAYEELKQLTQQSQQAVRQLVEALENHDSPPD